MADLRAAQLATWHQTQQGLSSVNLDVLSADASFRRYFRDKTGDSSYVLVDAPPASEKNSEFIALAAAYAKAGIDVPRVIASDTAQGFLCLTDLGDQLLLPLLQQGQLGWYCLAIRQLGLIARVEIPLQHKNYYDSDFFNLELSLFSDWFVGQLLNITLSERQKVAIADCFSQLVTSAVSQPQITVHRDFHSRNIMVRDNKSLAVIDFQDSVTGPLTYDAASLLKDCYFKLSSDRQAQLLQQCHQMYLDNASCQCDFKQFKRWFDLMALQRHLKVCGIFSRLYLRDGKDGYLNDLPLVICYIVEVCQIYPEFSPLSQLFNEQIMPALAARNR